MPGRRADPTRHDARELASSRGVASRWGRAPTLTLTAHACEHLHMSTDLPWPHVAGVFVQGGEDTITVDLIPEPNVINGGAPVRIGLAAGSNITWSKRLRFLDGAGTEIGTVSTQNDDRGPSWFDVSTSVPGLEFDKAKILGVMTGMYTTSPDGFPFRPGAHGYGLLFTWTKD